jgi:tetratricopeptide (TPR) repeat protein
MKKIILTSSFVLMLVLGFAQTGIQYQPMYTPKSNQEIISNEVLIKKKTVDNWVEKAKSLYQQEEYALAFESASQAEKLMNKYFSKSNVTAIYLQGRCLQKLGYQDDAKSYLEYARKYGLTSDKQIFSHL